MPETFPDLTPYEALTRMASDAAPTLLDVRFPEDQDGTRLPGAVVVAFDDLERHLALCPFGAVVICHKGLKISAGVTARLRHGGVDARRLSGGHVGWLAEGLPVTDTAAPDRIAVALEASAPQALTAWATARFIAPHAELLEVSLADLEAVRARFNAAAPAPCPIYRASAICPRCLISQRWPCTQSHPRPSSRCSISPTKVRCVTTSLRA